MKALKAAVRALALAGVGLASLSAARANEIVVTHYGSLLYGVPYAIALEKGYFKEAGIDITGILTSKGGGTSVRNMMAGETLFAEVALPAALSAIKEGFNIKIISGGTDGRSSFWVTRPGEKIDKPEDLKGKRFVYSRPKSVSESVTLAALKSWNVPAADVKMIAIGDFGAGLTALEHNKIDVAIIPEPIYSQKEKAGVKYKCKSCGHMHDDSFVVRTEMNNKGEFVPMNTSAPKGMVGFHWNALCGQWGMSWGSLAEEAIMAKKAFDEHGDETSRIEFKQKRLAVSWSDEPDDGGGEIMPSGYRLADVWVDEGAMVDGKLESAPITDDHRKAKIFARLRFMQVDVQRKGYYVVVRSWSSDGKSRMVYWGYVETDDQLRDVQVKYEVANFFTFLDSGDGPNTDSVYRLCARFGWNATKGSGQNEFAWRVQTPYGIKVAYRPYQRAKVIQVGAQSCKLYVFSNLVFKDSLSRLRRAGHHTYPEDAGDEYRKQMQSEHRTKNNAGTPIWVPVGDRANHLWDCEVMGILPAMMAKLIGKGKNRGATPTPEDEKPVKESTESP